ncbi:hypothetical protein GCM10011344_27020 [Dokdonia pacifica]|uniref:Uncharacterized protein n=1 Tax=Dokdonia pacifica TaxID=1627892 RepID=A0A239E9E9_9FLAO|nr:hypothetical protein [Dokdonia pacifica]GGG24953.1 hypothetical protein GCM10011344_27020 [Dokdonia pacifica]SNS40542.1 hypothetical protein SAMN06265376_11442 [Dokdonia pacifica]
METPSIVDTLIQNITTDQELLKDADAKITQAKEEKVTVADRLKGYRKEAEVFLKYANEEQKKQIEALGFDTAETRSSLNDVATRALNIIMETKGNSLTNDELYTIYAGSHKSPKDALNYTAFNIKCRPLFNSQRLIRKKAAEGLSSREDIISLNGTPIKKEERKDGVVEVKETSEIKDDAKQAEKKEASKTIALKKGTPNKKKDDTTATKK